MIAIKCDTGNTALLTEMIPFQGDLKKRSKEDLKDLGDSLLEDGLLMPFALWIDATGQKLILDGHGRRQALLEYVVNKDTTVLEQLFPVLLIEAPSEDEARKALLQITSTYGKFNKAAVAKFAAPIVSYKAPVALKAQHIVVRQQPVKMDDRATIRIRVPKDRVTELMGVLKKVDWLEVL